MVVTMIQMKRSQRTSFVECVMCLMPLVDEDPINEAASIHRVFHLFSNNMNGMRRLLMTHRPLSEQCKLVDRPS